MGDFLSSLYRLKREEVFRFLMETVFFLRPLSMIQNKFWKSLNLLCAHSEVVLITRKSFVDEHTGEGKN